VSGRTDAVTREFCGSPADTANPGGLVTHPITISAEVAALVVDGGGIA